MLLIFPPVRRLATGAALAVLALASSTAASAQSAPAKWADVFASVGVASRPDSVQMPPCLTPVSARPDSVVLVGQRVPASTVRAPAVLAPDLHRPVADTVVAAVVDARCAGSDVYLLTRYADRYLAVQVAPAEWLNDPPTIFRAVAQVRTVAGGRPTALVVQNDCSSGTCTQRVVDVLSIYKARIDSLGVAAARSDSIQRHLAALLAAKRRELLARGWPVRTVNMILDGRIAIGFTREQVREAWGPPRSVSQTLDRDGLHEQWTYDGGYVFFDNGRVTMAQR